MTKQIYSGYTIQKKKNGDYDTIKKITCQAKLRFNIFMYLQTSKSF